MAAAPIPENEGARLAALRRHAVLDTPADEIFDRLTRLASSILGTPIVLISLVDESRQWFASAVGLDIRSIPRDISFCAHAMLAADILVVLDATTDSRFAADPLVTGDVAVRFCAAVPLVGPDDARLGMCACSTAGPVPRAHRPRSNNSCATSRRWPSITSSFAGRGPPSRPAVGMSN